MKTRKIFGFVCAAVVIFSCVGCAAQPAPVPTEPDEEVSAVNESGWLEKSKWPSMLVDVDEVMVEALSEFKCNTGYDGEVYYVVVGDNDFSHSDAVVTGLADEVASLTISIYEACGVEAFIVYFDRAGNVVLGILNGVDVTNTF